MSRFNPTTMEHVHSILTCFTTIGSAPNIGQPLKASRSKKEEGEENGEEEEKERRHFLFSFSSLVHIDRATKQNWSPKREPIKVLPCTKEAAKMVSVFLI